MTALRVRPKLRIVYATAGRPDVMTRGTAYRGAVLASVAKRCDCDRHTGALLPGELPEICDYHEALEMGRRTACAQTQHRLAVLDRLARIYKASDDAVLAASTTPQIDLSHMREDELHEISVAIDWHLANGKHKPARKRKRAKP